ncbi:hypothetical protein AQJ27_44530 [Streptomyces olivochromogenes]|nr:hypothetical protein AQJ27_44530 [Streptomyces olivochromogenes]
MVVRRGEWVPHTIVGPNSSTADERAPLVWSQRGGCGHGVVLVGRVSAVHASCMYRLVVEPPNVTFVPGQCGE